jgi:hypothetical protein
MEIAVVPSVQHPVPGAPTQVLDEVVDPEHMKWTQSPSLLRDGRRLGDTE